MKQWRSPGVWPTSTTASAVPPRRVSVTRVEAVANALEVHSVLAGIALVEHDLEHDVVVAPVLDDDRAIGRRRHVAEITDDASSCGADAILLVEPALRALADAREVRERRQGSAGDDSMRMDATSNSITVSPRSSAKRAVMERLRGGPWAAAPWAAARPLPGQGDGSDKQRLLQDYVHRCDPVLVRLDSRVRVVELELTLLGVDAAVAVADREAVPIDPIGVRTGNRRPCERHVALVVLADRKVRGRRRRRRAIGVHVYERRRCTVALASRRIAVHGDDPVAQVVVVLRRRAHVHALRHLRLRERTGQLQ